jgi:hypothetical protein
VQLWTWKLRTRNCSSIPGRGRIFFSVPVHPNWLWDLPPSYCMCKGDSFLRDKVAEDWGWPFTSVQCLGSEWVVICLHSLTCLNGVHVDKFCYIYWQVYAMSLIFWGVLYQINSREQETGASSLVMCPVKTACHTGSTCT